MSSEGFHKENTRIARNTVIIYIRMMVIIAIGLVSMRLVLKALGQSDLGLYDVVAGLISMLGFISTAMSTTTRRYINIEMGKDGGNPNKVFNILMNIHIALAVLILLLAESFGMWYIYNVLEVEPGKLADAVFVFQVSTVVACAGIINIPYQSLMEAHEKFGAAAAIDIVTNIVKLGLVCLLFVFEGNSLRFYAVSMSAVTVLTLILYHGYCAAKWKEIIRRNKYSDKALYREILGFNNYTAMSAIAYIARTQGSKLIVNGFFGTFVNGAFTPAYNLENFSVMGITRLGNAASPQITQNYASNNLGRSFDLVEKISRFTALMMILLVSCLLVEMDFILELWLGNVPEGTPLLCRWTLVSALVRCFAMGGTQTLEQASGKIKWFHIINSSLSLSCLPLGALAFWLGAEPVAIIWIYIGYTFIYRIIELCLMRRLLDFPVGAYLRKSYLKPLIVCAAMAAFIAVYQALRSADASAVFRLSGVAATFVFCCFMIFFVGMYKWERKSVLRL